MKKLLLNRKVQKAFLPLALVCILPLWLILLKDGSPSLPIYILAGIGALFLLLDRILKPRELERAEKRRQETEKLANRKSTEE